MKQILFFCCILLVSLRSAGAYEIVETAYFSANPELGNEISIVESKKFKKNKKASIEFSVVSQSQESYYVNFWIFPSEKKDGSYNTYDVCVNGQHVGLIRPESSGWQSLGISGEQKVSLIKGENIINITSATDVIPDIEHVRFSKSQSLSAISSKNYADYIKQIKLQSSLRKLNNIENKPWMGDSLQFIASDFKPITDSNKAVSGEDPLYDYVYRRGMTATYTFYTTASFAEGQEINITSEGVDRFPHVLEVFSATTPENYSWVALCNSDERKASLNIKIHQTGLYYIRVRSYYNARSGFCNLNINNENIYKNVPAFSTGVRCVQDTDQEYNTFTHSECGDPVLWIEEGTAIPGKISYFNDDYFGEGTYGWQSDSRIRQKFNRPVHAVLVSTYSSYNPFTKFDLYIKCKKYNISDSFKLLKEDDGIASAPKTHQYNCISWSGGITSYWEWPPSSFSDFYSNDPLTSFDNFYASRGLSRIGANSANGTVALWAVVDAAGNRDYAHASITSGGDNNLHGYAWESKTGANTRIFHPKHSLEGLLYGQIVEYYKRDKNSTSRINSLVEEIADRSAQIEYVNFNEEEQSLIEKNISSINPSVLDKFNILYDSWNEVAKNSILSSFSQMSKCKEYAEVLNFCKEHPEVINLLYKYLDNNEWTPLQLIEDLLVDDTPAIQTILKEAKRIKSNSDIKTVRSPISNCISFVKSILRSEGINEGIKKISPSVISDISYSNAIPIEISQSNGCIEISYSLCEKSVVSIDMLDMTGTVIDTLMSPANLQEGLHSHSYTINQKGVVLIRLQVNGRVNIKKINI